MNKKFIKISLIICVSFVLLVGFFSITSVNENNFDELENSIEIKYKDYTETKDSYNLSIIVKNKSKNIASMSDMELSFGFKGDHDDMGDFYIKGHEKDAWSDDKVMGIDPGKEEEFIFKIPKGIKIDKDYYDTNTIEIGYMANFFKFRTGKNSLFLGVSQMGGTKTLGGQY